MKKNTKTLLSLAALLLSGQTSFGAIIYTDITDAHLSTTGTFAINMDNTGADEYSFDNTMGSPYIMFDPNMHLGTVSTGEWDVIKGYDLNTPINSSLGFYDQGDGGINPGWQTTYTFPSSVDKYLGCQFNIGSSTYYGWIRVQLVGTDLIFKDYAYNNTANAAINAGDTGSSSAVLVTSITVTGAGNASTISTMGGTLQMSAAVAPSNASVATYTWSVQNGTGTATISGKGLLTALTNGTVTVKATANDASGVIGTKVITISNQTNGIVEMAMNEFSVYPNPITDQLNIQYTGKSAVHLIEIYTVNGEKVLSIASDMTQSIDVSTLKRGSYFVSIQLENDEVVRVKIVK